MKRPHSAKPPLVSSSAADSPPESTRGDQGDFSQALGDRATAASPAAASWRPTVLAAGLIVLAAVAAYHNSFAGPFIFDDTASIVENRTIRQLWPIWPVLSPPCNGETVGGRPLLNLSLAINYAVGGLEVRGYHATNLAIHIAAALLLFGILRRTFLSRKLRDRFGGAAVPLALASAMLWSVHPLHTESVTYVVQRAESLMGFCYLLTLYCVIRGTGCGLGTVSFSAAKPILPRVMPGDKRDGPPWPAQFVWYAAAVLACLLGMAVKEVTLTAPLIVLLYDRTFLAGSFGEAVRRRWGLYVGLAATWGLLAYLVLSTGLIGRQPEMGAPDAWSYARSQPGVILHYLRLSVWPSPLCFDYAWPVADSLGQILPGAIVVGVLVAATLWGLTGRKPWGFLGAWCLLILAPTSSILPLGQLTFEHRMYLSLAAVAVLVVAGGYALWDRLLPRPAAAGYGATGVRWAAPVVALLAVLLALGYAAVARNRDYRSLLAICQDTVDKRPHNPIAHNNLGHALAALGKTDEAIEHCHQALRLKPDFALAYYNLANVLAGVGKTGEAIERYHQALRLKPDLVEVHNNLAIALAKLGRADEAIEHYHQALRLKPEHATAHNNLGHALASLGRTDEALAQYQEALRLKPDYVEVHNNLGITLAALGRTDEALAQYHAALRLKPDFPEVHYNLGIALAQAGRTDEAIEHYCQALRLEPDFAVAHFNLASVLDSRGRRAEAVEHYRDFLQLVPDSTRALSRLAWLLATSDPAQGGDPALAVRLAQRARELGGQENAQCLDTLAVAYAAAGRFADAVLTAQRAMQLAQSTGQAPLAKLIQSRLELYRAGRPCRESPPSPGQPTR